MLKDHKKLERLMLFSEVAQHLSFTVASKKLGISRGHLSAQIKQLENGMGIPLLLRSTRSVRLTSEGERVLASMDNIRLSLLELERNAQNEGQAIAGNLKITAPLQFTERYLLDICADFKKLYPNIDFSIDCSYTSYDLNRSKFDLAFRATNNPPQNMIAKSILSYQHCCYASPSYWLQQPKPLEPKDLIQHQCLYAQGQSTWLFKEEEIKVNGWLILNDNNLLKRQALLGMGVIRVAEYLVDKEVEDGSLVRVLEPFAPQPWHIQLVHPQLIHQSKRLSAFIDFTVERFNTNKKN